LGIHTPCDRNNSANNLRVDTISQPEESSRGGGARPDHEHSVLQAAGGTRAVSIARFEDIKGLRPNWRGKGRCGSLALPVYGKKHRIPEIRMKEISGCSGPKQIANGQIRQSNYRWESVPKKIRHLLDLALNCFEEVGGPDGY